MARPPFTVDGPFAKPGLWDRITLPVLATGAALVFTVGLIACIFGA